MRDPASEERLFHEIDGRLRNGAADNLAAVLDFLLDHFHGEVGTIHRLDPADNILHLLTHRGLPEGLLPRVTAIPVGKGMAGIAAERRQPVSVCNLQTDGSGVAQPGARQTGMQGSVAVPMLAGGQLHGVLGVAKATTHQFDETEIGLLIRVAARIGEHLSSRPMAPSGNR
jgi:GAF domain-containing protein